MVPVAHVLMAVDELCVLVVLVVAHVALKLQLAAQSHAAAAHALPSVIVAAYVQQADHVGPANELAHNAAAAV